MTGRTGSAAPAPGDELTDDGGPAGEAVPPLPRRIPGQARRFWPSREPEAGEGESGAGEREPGTVEGEPGAGEPAPDAAKSESGAAPRAREEPDAAKSEPGASRRGPGTMTGIPAWLRPGLSAWLASQRTAAGKAGSGGQPAPAGDLVPAGEITPAVQSAPAGEITPAGESAPAGEITLVGEITPTGGPAPAGKPTPADLGIDLGALEWECSGDGEGRIEVAFPVGPASADGATWTRGEWVIMRVTGDRGRRVLVFDRNEWECFLDGVRNGEFDDAV